MVFFLTFHLNLRLIVSFLCYVWLVKTYTFVWPSKTCLSVLLVATKGRGQRKGVPLVGVANTCSAYLAWIREASYRSGNMSHFVTNSFFFSWVEQKNHIDKSYFKILKNINEHINTPTNQKKKHSSEAYIYKEPMI